MKKNLTLELIYSIPELIAMQKFTIQVMKDKPNSPEGAINYQEDILRVLEMVAKINMVNLDFN